MFRNVVNKIDLLYEIRGEYLNIKYASPESSNEALDATEKLELIEEILKDYGELR